MQVISRNYLRKYSQNLPSFCLCYIALCYIALRYIALWYIALCYTMLHKCGHTILHNYSVIIFCDGETSEIFLTTRALIYADLMGDYCDSWKVFTGPLTNVREHCGQFFFMSDIKWRFANFWKYFRL